MQFLLGGDKGCPSNPIQLPSFKLDRHKECIKGLCSMLPVRVNDFTGQYTAVVMLHSHAESALDNHQHMLCIV